MLRWAFGTLELFLKNGGIERHVTSTYIDTPNDQVHRAAANDFEFKNRRGPPLRCNALLSRFHYGAAQWTTVLDIMLFGCELSE